MQYQLASVKWGSKWRELVMVEGERERVVGGCGGGLGGVIVSAAL